MKSFALGSAFALISLLLPSLASGQAQLIRDINTEQDRSVNEYSELTDWNGNFFFVSEGKKLYIRKGNAATPVMLRSLIHISELTVVDNDVFFVGEDGAGRELWKTNGTGATTRRVKEIRAGKPGGDPMGLVYVAGVLYFSADDGVNGRELWKSDGTDAGTVRVKDINSGSGSSNPAWITEMNGLAYFSAYESTRGENLWKSDGTAAGTVLVADIRSTNAVGEGPAWITNLNGTLFFSAEGASTGIELWKSDGTKAGTKLVKDIFPGITSSKISEITAMNGAVYFSAKNNPNSLKLWKSDGINTTIVTSLLEGSTTDTNDPAFYFTAIGNYLYYSDYYKGNIVATDGTPFTSHYGGEQFHTSDNPHFTAYNGMIYYLAITFDDEEYRNHLDFNRMSADGTNRHLVKSFPYFVDMGVDPFPEPALEMVEVNGALYFTASPNDENGFVMMISDGTTAGTVEFADTYAPTFSGDPANFAVLNGFTFFSAETGEHDEVWRTDGTSAGSLMLQQVGVIYDMKTVGNLVYFVGNQERSFKLWRSDGTTAGTVLLKDFGTGYNNNTISLEDVYGTVYFTPGHGELWKSDGTTSGTILLRDFHEIEYIGHGGYGGGRAIFLVRTSSNATELWRSNGTTTGTNKLRTMNPNSTLGAFVYPPKVTLNSIFYFPGNDGEHGVELWRSDGTAVGTYIVKDIAQNDYNVVDIHKMFNHNDKLYFTANTPNGYVGLYESNGTSEGTTLVNGVRGETQAELIPYGDSFLNVSGHQSGNGVLHIDGAFLKTLSDEPESGIFYYVITNNVVYFTYGRSLWRTDGTACGTVKMTSVKNVYPMVLNGSDLIFGALHPDYGREPHRMPLSSDPGNPCGATIETTSASLFSSAAEPVSDYKYGPNPFSGDLNFRIEGKEGETVSIQVTTFAGEIIDTVHGLETNTDHKLGERWPKGIYVIRATRNGKMEMVRVVKK